MVVEDDPSGCGSNSSYTSHQLPITAHPCYSSWVSRVLHGILGFCTVTRYTINNQCVLFISLATNKANEVEQTNLLRNRIFWVYTLNPAYYIICYKFITSCQLVVSLVMLALTARWLPQNSQRLACSSLLLLLRFSKMKTPDGTHWSCAGAPNASLTPHPLCLCHEGDIKACYSK